MSNLTDGKAALAAGKFTTAENKFNRALDAHPDDGEIWWALMLCRAECRNDAEFSSKLKTAFTAAARNGAPQPATPLDTPYGKNALRYAKGESGQKRREYVSALTAELNTIWQTERGDKLKFKNVKTVKQAKPKRSSAAAVTVYALIGLCFVLGGVSAYAAFAKTTWLFWVGTGVFVACEAAAVWLIYRSSSNGIKIAAAIPLAIIAGLTFGIAVFATAFAVNDRVALIAAAVAICLAAAIAAFKLLPAKKERGQARRARGGNKEPTEMAEKKERPKLERDKKADDYSDDFD